MKLTSEQQAVLDGAKGEKMAKIMKTLVMYGDTFGAEKMVPVNKGYGHTVISFGAGPMKPVYDLYDELIAAGIVSEQKFSADPRPIDPNVPMSGLQKLAAKKLFFPIRRTMRSSSGRWASCPTTPTPAPAIWTR